MSDQDSYSYASSVKSSTSDELINTYIIRPLAGIVVRLLFSTTFSPNHVTIASTVVGILAAFFYLDGSASRNILAGICIFLKDTLDSADGQLARARQQYTRAGRFLDSLGDFLVNLLVFGALGVALYRASHSIVHVGFAALAFLGTTLRVSYHVFYQTSFLHLAERYQVNRVTEEIQTEDLRHDAFTLHLQKIFQALYGWQDRLMIALDRWCRKRVSRTASINELWFGDHVGLRISGLLGLGTEMFLLMLFSLINRLEMYLVVNVALWNALWLASVCYRKFFLAGRINRLSPPAH